MDRIGCVQRGRRAADGDGDEDDGGEDGGKVAYTRQRTHHTGNVSMWSGSGYGRMGSGMQRALLEHTPFRLLHPTRRVVVVRLPQQTHRGVEPRRL
jgi:hypothetical protein